MFIANSSSRCFGTITRERNMEKSILDYIVVCEGLFKLLNVMVIDEMKINVLRHTIKTKRSYKHITSDHNILHGSFNISYKKQPPKVRVELFDYKSAKSLRKYFEDTNTSNTLSSCFTHSESLLEGAKRFFR